MLLPKLFSILAKWGISGVPANIIIGLLYFVVIIGMVNLLGLLDVGVEEKWRNIAGIGTFIVLIADGAYHFLWVTRKKS